VHISPELLKIRQLVGQGSFGEVFEVRRVFSTLKLGSIVFER
jgi:hypothetical protein